MSNHKEELIKIYEDSLQDESSEFMKLILKAAIRRLKGGNDPSWVEDWVVDMEKNWRALGKNANDTKVSDNQDTMFQDNLTMYVGIFLSSIGILAYHLIVHKSIMGEPYMIFLSILLGIIIPLLSLISVIKILLTLSKNKKKSQPR